MTYEICPARSNLLIEKCEFVKKGLIEMPHNAAELTQIFEVKAVGPDVETVVVGDYILLASFQGINIRLPYLGEISENQRIIAEGEILGKVKIGK